MMKTARGRRLFFVVAALSVAASTIGLLTGWADDLVVRDKKGQVIVRFSLPEGTTVGIEQESGPQKIEMTQAVRLTADGHVADQILAAGGSFLYMDPKDGSIHDSKLTAALPEGFQITEVRLPYVGTARQIADIMRIHLPWIGKLTTVDVSGAAIDESHAAAFRDLIKLKKLSLADTLVTDGFLPVLKLMQQLEELDLSGTLVTGGGVAELSNLPKLHTLRLDRTAVGERDVAGLLELKRLKTVSLDHTQLNDAALSTLERWKGLDKLSLRSVKISPTGTERLRAALAPTELSFKGVYPDFVLPLPSKFRERKVRELPPSAEVQEVARGAFSKRFAALARKTLDVQRLRALQVWEYAREKKIPESYVPYCEARDAAARAGDVVMLEQIVDEVDTAYKIDVGPWRAAGWRAAVDDWDPLVARNVLAELLRAADEADVDGQFDLAAEYVKLADDCAARFEIDDQQPAIQAAAERSAWRKREAPAVADALRSFQADRRNKTASAVIGKHWCTVEGDWPKGLASLAWSDSSVWGSLGSTAADNWKSLQNVHVNVLAQTAEGVPVKEHEWTNYLRYGDGWYDAAQKLDGREKQELLRAAAEWYVPLAELMKKSDNRYAEIQARVVSREMLDAQNHTLGYGPRRSLRLELAPGVYFRARRVPAGEFMMGTDTAVDERTDPERLNDERPAHPVVLPRPFYMGTTEITYRQYDALMGKPSEPSPADPLASLRSLSFDDAQQFVRVLNLSPVGERYRFRLPTEAEWEYVRQIDLAPDGQPDDFSTSSDWSFGTMGERKYARIGRRRCNSLGIFDLREVGEWCQDWYDRDYYVGSPRINPRGPASSPLAMRVRRGRPYYGSSGMTNARPTYRDAASPESDSGGLRLVVEPRLVPATPPTPRPRNRVLNDSLRQAHFLLSHGAVIQYSTTGPGPKRSAPARSLPALPEAPFKIVRIEFGERSPPRMFDLQRLRDFPEVVVLDLSSQSVTAEQLRQLAPLVKVEELRLGGAKLTDGELTPLQTLSELRLVDLSDTKVGDAGLKELAALPKLKSLYMSGCPVTDAGMENLWRASELSVVQFSRTGLTDKALQSLVRIGTLRKIELIDCPKITAEGVAAFRKEAPECSVVTKARTFVTPSGLPPGMSRGLPPGVVPLRPSVQPMPDPPKSN